MLGLGIHAVDLLSDWPMILLLTPCMANKSFHVHLWHPEL